MVLVEGGVLLRHDEEEKFEVRGKDEGECDYSIRRCWLLVAGVAVVVTIWYLFALKMECIRFKI